MRHLAKLRWFPSSAKSPWSWPLFALVAVAAVGQWAGVTVAEGVAAGFGAIGIGVAIGLAVAGKIADRPEPSADHQQPSGRSSSEATASGELTLAPKEPGPHARRTVDLRGARLVNAMLVCADLRQADLRVRRSPGPTSAELTSRAAATRPTR